MESFLVATMCVCMCVCVYWCASVSLCTRAYVSVCVCARARVCVCVNTLDFIQDEAILIRSKNFSGMERRVGEGERIIA